MMIVAIAIIRCVMQWFYIRYLAWLCREFCAGRSMKVGLKFSPRIANAQSSMGFVER